ncbi:hypothetical protein BJ165DRAFT_1517610 [Panaeolus papilionaceus]|nr:hypothetical protein BJ165DRAFT_1517610 [Panaeolus papilionaceus]
MPWQRVSTLFWTNVTLVILTQFDRQSVSLSAHSSLLVRCARLEINAAAGLSMAALGLLDSTSSGTANLPDALS